MAKLYDDQFRWKQLNVPIEIRLNDDPEIKVKKAITEMLEAIAYRIDNNFLDPIMSVAFSVETQNNSSMLLADLEYWNGN